MLFCSLSLRRLSLRYFDYQFTNLSFHNPLITNLSVNASFFNSRYFSETVIKEEIKIEQEYDVIHTAEDCKDWIKKIQINIRKLTEDTEIWFAIDTEYQTISPAKSNVRNSNLLMIQIYGNPINSNDKSIMDKPMIFQIAHPSGIDFKSHADMTEKHSINKELFQELSDCFLCSNKYHKIYHYYSADYHSINNEYIKLKWNNYQLKGFVCDTFHMARLLNAGNEEYNLKYLSEYYLSSDLTKSETFFEYASNEFPDEKIKPLDAQQLMTNYPERFYSYAGRDATSTFELAKILKQNLMKNECQLQQYQQITETQKFLNNNVINAWDIYESDWRPFAQILVDMESNGFCVDLQHLKKEEKNAEQRMMENFEKFRAWAVQVTDYAHVKDINCLSKIQLGHLFFGGSDSEMEIKIINSKSEFYKKKVVLPVKKCIHLAFL